LIEAFSLLRQLPRSVNFIPSGDDSRRVGYADLFDRALLLLHQFQEQGLTAGDEMILLLRDPQQFVEAFWACVLGGIVPVPVAIGISDEHRAKLFRIFDKLRRPHLYTVHSVFERLQPFALQNGLDQAYRTLRSKTILVESIHASDARGEIHAASPDDTAFIQFSSGSTSEPKGVVLTHGGLMVNIQDMHDAGRFSPDDISLSWMPLTHDLGLIGFHLLMLCNQMDHHIMATDVFIRRPLLWIETASRERINCLCSPNFGYRHFLKMFRRRGLPDDVDLGHIRAIFNGAEPISVSLIDEFMTALAPYGLQRDVMVPVYGLAEACLGVAFAVPGSSLHCVDVDRRALGTDRSVVPPGDASRSLRLVGVGRPIGRCEVMVADEDGRPIAENRVGRVLIRGPNVTPGYYDEPALNAEIISEAGWLDTGDLGFFRGGDLFITGRTKDVIFVHGQNFYAHDLEAIAETVEGLELGKVAVGACRDPASGDEQLVVFVLYRGALDAFGGIRHAVTQLLTAQTGADIAYVVPVHQIPKTTSGKVQRYMLVQAFENGDFDEVIRALYKEEMSPGAAAEGDDPVESALLAICDRILGEQRVGRDDNFFDLGTNSLKLIEVHSEIDALYPGTIEVTDMFDHPTVAELAAFIQSRRSAAADREPVQALS